MFNWNLWNGEANQWDLLVTQFPDYSVFQSFAWGLSRQKLGWKILRFIAYDDSIPVALAQILYRKYPFGFGIVWIPGGPLGRVTTWDINMIRSIRMETSLRFFYCRFNSMAASSETSINILSARGWRVPNRKLTSGLTLVYSPSQPEELRLSLCSGNWRHNYRRSLKRNLDTKICDSVDPSEIMRIYKSMQDYKGLCDQTSAIEIESVLSSFGDSAIIIQSYDNGGELLSIRGALFMGSKAWDIFAATSPLGRKYYASYSTFWALMNVCEKRGVELYDLGGADPIKNRGVYDFKKGIGSYDYTYLGEWELSHPNWLRYVFNYIVGRISR